jgi:hypothetical protein
MKTQNRSGWEFLSIICFLIACLTLLAMGRQVAELKTVSAKLNHSLQENAQLEVSLVEARIDLWKQQKDFDHFTNTHTLELLESETYQLQLVANIETLNEESATHRIANSQLTRQVNFMRQSFGAAKQMIQNAQNEADLVLRQCLEMHIADGSSKSPSVENPDSKDQS